MHDVHCTCRVITYSSFRFENFVGNVLPGFVWKFECLKFLTQFESKTVCSDRKCIIYINNLFIYLFEFTGVNFIKWIVAIALIIIVFYHATKEDMGKAFERVHSTIWKHTLPLTRTDTRAMAYKLSVENNLNKFTDGMPEATSGYFILWKSNI